jgi:hypothetical protein
MTNQENDNGPVVDAQLAIGREGIVIDFQDILATGVVILAIGAVVVAIVLAVGLSSGRVSCSDAKGIILGCVGGSAIAAVAAAVIGRKTRKRKA